MNHKICIFCNNIIIPRTTESVNAFSVRKFCSRSCANKVNNIKYPKRKKQGKCLFCDLEINTRFKYCDKCKQNIKENF